MKLPVGEEPVLGKHIIEVTESIKKSAPTLCFWNSTINNTGPTYVFGPNNDDTSTEGEATYLISKNCILTNFTIKHIEGTDSKRVKYTARLNSKNTAIVLVQEARNSTPLSTKTSIPIKQFDLLSIQIDRPDGNFSGAQPTRVLLSFELI